MAGQVNELKALYLNALLEDVLPFWESHSVDREHGGFFTCLDRAGEVFDTDKFVWLQARQVWTFAAMYNRFEQRDTWLEIARHGASFLREFGRSESGEWYFSLTRQGQPLIQPYSIFTDCFAAMGFGQYALASGDEQARDITVETFHNILSRRTNPKGRYAKQVPATRPLESLALPMILVNLSLELEGVVPQERLNRTIEECLETIMTLFYDESQGLLFDNVAPDGSHPDCFEGRVILPGHGIEAMWFILDIARQRDDRGLADQATDIILRLIEYGWDPEYEGMLYYRDAHGHPPQQLEWDRKLWWVHVETLVALLKAYVSTGRAACWQWFERVHAYTWKMFPDPEFGEWFGYLDRQGRRFLDLKGGKWKSCYHIPRALYLCSQELARLANPPQE